ncbi:hypothetical protein [Streptomyces shenzhenensis]|uniref:Uncharacterized protein n=1 Tax=Streptomyces shenzhenensis TaxID=943815 RepID=A0A3M0HRD3_9ACTN|nr:hypothetical protein [Streptomyces shenzhenensis]RMB80011.1 hypothetical protein CTZ28_42655 [Streptomyces shenzhenensis]
MFQDSPIYDRLVAERGDVPAGVRREADRLRREVEAVMLPLRPPGVPGAVLPPPPAPSSQWQRVHQLPGAGVP